MHLGTVLSLVIMPTELNNQRNAAILHFNCMGLGVNDHIQFEYGSKLKRELGSLSQALNRSVIFISSLLFEESNVLEF